MKNRSLIWPFLRSDKLMVQVAMVFLFAVKCGSAPHVTVQSVLVAIADILQQGDKGCCGSPGAIWESG